MLDLIIYWGLYWTSWWRYYVFFYCYWTKALSIHFFILIYILISKIKNYRVFSLFIIAFCLFICCLFVFFFFAIIVILIFIEFFLLLLQDTDLNYLYVHNLVLHLHNHVLMLIHHVDKSLTYKIDIEQKLLMLFFFYIYSIGHFLANQL